MSKENKKILRRKIGNFFLRLFGTLTKYFSPKLIEIIGTFLGLAGYRFVRRYRKIAIKSLKLAYPKFNDKKINQLAKKSSIILAQSALELFYFLSHERAVENIEIEGKEYLDEALASGRGVIGVSAHYGNFPLIAFKLAKLGYPAWVMARPMRDEQAGDYIENWRKKVGIKTIFSYPRRECVIKTIQVLRQNGIVIIQSDQNFGTGGVWVKFFGHLAATPTGVVVFAMRTNAVMLPMYIYRKKLMHHVIKIFPPLPLIQRENKDEMVLLNVIQYTRHIEQWIRQCPEQWAWIHDRWKSRPSKTVWEKPYMVERG